VAAHLPLKDNFLAQLKDVAGTGVKNRHDDRLVHAGLFGLFQKGCPVIGIGNHLAKGTWSQSKKPAFFLVNLWLQRAYLTPHNRIK